MKKVAVIDYGMCNLDSVARALGKCGADPVVTSEVSLVEAADAVILPGVGAFCDAMGELRSRGLIPVLQRRVLEENVPFLGICLGMQLMADRGLEGGEVAGLGLIPGDTVCLEPDTSQTRIPHIGWNEVMYTGPSSLFEGISDNTDFYFVHSYHFRCPPEYIIGRTPYCSGFVSAVQKGRCFGVQFHPEKSQKAGIRILKNFCAC